jgi:hypothetical protein
MIFAPAGRETSRPGISCGGWERGELHLFPIQTWIGRENLLHLKAGGHRRGHIVHRHPGSPDDGCTAQNLRVSDHLRASLFQPDWIGECHTRLGQIPGDRFSDHFREFGRVPGEETDTLPG